MAGNDPTETGGLFIGRRPGTAPLRYRGTPTRAGRGRRRVDAVLAAGILILEALLLTTLWGPQPAGWLWLGSQIFHETGSVSIGILVAFLGMLLTILVTIRLAMVLDRSWKLVRRASGHDQQTGALERIFVISMVIAGTAFFVWFLVIHGPGPDLSPSQG
jgi:uncharacterized membrane protein (DUF485 family)